ncbi:MAG: hypothetical protein H8E35_05705 [Ardenticatenia bacterium]|nr:hypothetical protein [Ardenticatenia bacterium]
MERINWTQVVVFSVIVLLIFGCGLILLITAFGGGWGMMGPGMMGGRQSPYGDSGGWCPWCGGTGRFSGSGLFGGLAGLLTMGFVLLVPLGLIVLGVLGVIWLVRTARPKS